MKRVLLVGTAIPVLALGLASAVNLPKKLIYNASESAPIGFYWIDQQPISRGDYVYVRVPERVRRLVIERKYLPPDVPLLKRVVGLNGDRICRDGTEISVNGTVVATAEWQDGLGRKMPDWHGCYIITERTVFLLQEHPRSFDGRYFGPVDRRLIFGRATRVRLPWRKDEQC
ncbi:MAG: S26 family signal peptidase [Gammaproteobacteria bacterium]